MYESNVASADFKKYADKQSELVFYHYVANYHKFIGKTMHIYYLIVSVSEGSRHSVTRFSAQDFTRRDSKCD